MALKLSKDEAKNLEAARQAYADAATDFNAKLADFNTLLEEIVEAKRGEWDEKSEKWQESDKGEAARLWIQTFENIQSELQNAEVNFDDCEIADEPDGV